MPSVTVEEAQARLPELLSEVQSGEKVIITQNQEPIAELSAYPGKKPQPQFGSCRGKLVILAEDDEHLEDFKEYMS